MRQYDAVLLGEVVGLAHEKLLQGIPLAVDLLGKGPETLITEDFVSEKVHGQDGNRIEILLGQFHVMFLVFTPGLEVAVFDFGRENAVHDDSVDVHPVKAEVHEGPLGLFQNDFFRVGNKSDARDLGIDS